MRVAGGGIAAPAPLSMKQQQHDDQVIAEIRPTLYMKCPELDTDKFNKYLDTLSEWDEICNMGPAQKYYHLKDTLRKHKDGGLYADRLDMSLKDSRDRDNIIRLCITELKKYFGKPAMQQHAEQLSKFWDIKRTQDETIKEFVQRFCNERAKLEEYGFKKSDKEVTIIF